MARDIEEPKLTVFIFRSDAAEAAAAAEENRVPNATIERCAQVVENFHHEGAIPFGLKSEIATAIRSLKK